MKNYKWDSLVLHELEMCMVKVLFLVENSPVPNDTRAWCEATALRDQGCLVSVICPRETMYDRESYICLEGIHIYRYHLPATSNRYTSYIVEYIFSLCMVFYLSLKVLFRQGFDVIHAANPPDMFFTIGWVYGLLGKKFIFDQRDLAPELFQVKFQRNGRILHRVLLFLEWCSYRTADVVITSNASQKRFALERGHCALDKVHVIGNGPDLIRFRPGQPAYELKQGKRFLLAYVGEMGVQDGVEFALYALYELVHKRGRRDVSLVLMGDGCGAPVLRALADELQLDACVNFTGWVEYEDVVRYLTVADIGLTPDPQNGFNEYCTMVKTMEYMAMGKPVVAFDLVETRVSAQGAALYAIPNLVEDFASKIETLLNDEELRLSMGAYGRKRVEDILCWKHDKKNLLLAYKMLFPDQFKS